MMIRDSGPAELISAAEAEDALTAHRETATKAAVSTRRVRVTGGLLAVYSQKMPLAAGNVCGSPASASFGTPPTQPAVNSISVP